MTKKRTKRAQRRPSSIATSGIPMLPNGRPDYSKFPNPFVVKGWSFDAGGASGQAEDERAPYTEFSLGANAYFYRWLAWRNSAFMRNGERGAKLYGLDMSERFSYEFSEETGLGVFASPGFRFAGGQHTAPFGEGGLIMKIGPVQLCAGARQLLHSWVRTGGANETQFFVGLGLGGPR